MSNTATRYESDRPTRAQIKQAKRAKLAAYRKSPRGQRRTKGRQAGYMDRRNNIAQLSQAEQDIINKVGA